MGVYDSIRVACPKCGESTLEFQVRHSGWHRTYSINDVPMDVARAFEADGETDYCSECGAEYKLSRKPKKPQNVPMYLVEV